MSLAVAYNQTSFRPDFSEDFGKIVLRMAEPLEDEAETRQQMFFQAETLCAMLELATKNPIELADNVITLVQAILDGMQRHLDGEKEPIKLSPDEMRRLEKLYLDMCQYVCEITIRQADAAKRA